MKFTKAFVHKVKRFKDDTHGGVYGILLAFGVFAIVGGFGAIALDAGGRASALKQRLNKCLDSAGSSSAKYVLQDEDEGLKRINMYFAANCPSDVYYSEIEPTAVAGTDYVTLTRDGTKFKLEAKGKTFSTVGQIAGYGDVDVAAVSSFETSRFNLEIAIAVDNSGSMNSEMNNDKTRLENSQDAIKKLIKKIYGEQGGTIEGINVSIMPFAGTINIGPHDQPWTRNWLLPHAVEMVPYEYAQNEFIHYYSNENPNYKPGEDHPPHNTKNKECGGLGSGSGYVWEDPYDLQNLLKDRPATFPCGYVDEDYMETGTTEDALAYIKDLAALVDPPEEVCDYRGDAADYWSADYPSYFTDPDPVRWVPPTTKKDTNGYCIMGKSKIASDFNRQDICETPGAGIGIPYVFENVPIGAWDGANCWVGDYWKGCIFERFDTLYRPGGYHPIIATRGEWPLAIKPNSLMDATLAKNDYKNYYEESDGTSSHPSYLFRNFINDHPPYVLQPGDNSFSVPSNITDTNFLPYYWPSHNGVGTRSYEPYLAQNPTSSSRPNSKLYPLGLGVMSQSSWKNAFSDTANAADTDEVDYDTTYEPEKLFEAMKGNENLNDYFGGYNLTDGNGRRLTQLLDERIRLNGSSTGRAPMWEDIDTYIDDELVDDGSTVATPRGPNVGCTEPSGFLMDDRTRIEEVVDAMFPVGNEQSRHSLAFAWIRRAFSPDWKKTEADGTKLGILNPAFPDLPADPGKERHKKIGIVMFDGLSKVVNYRGGMTKMHAYYATMGQSTSDTFDKMSVADFLMGMKICDEMKNDDPNIELFVILFAPNDGDINDLFNLSKGDFRWFENTSGTGSRMDHIKDMYEECASPDEPDGPQHFFYLNADDDTALDDAFQKIADRLLKVRISQ